MPDSGRALRPARWGGPLSSLAPAQRPTAASAQQLLSAAARLLRVAGRSPPPTGRFPLPVVRCLPSVEQLVLQPRPPFGQMLQFGQGLASCSFIRAERSRVPAAGSRSIGCPLQGRILENSCGPMAIKPSLHPGGFRSSKEVLLWGECDRSSKTPLFKLAGIALLPMGCARRRSGKNPVNGYHPGSRPPPVSETLRLLDREIPVTRWLTDQQQFRHARRPYVIPASSGARCGSPDTKKRTGPLVVFSPPTRWPDEASAFHGSGLG